ncbi:MAG TPA: HAD-IB family phosphatase [Elusimicrobiales bacterium]|nr:HAD-IB family phosphatase [Elusimicrobiales bacterium]
MRARRPSPAGWAAVSDFDGTITLRDVGDSLLLHYGYSDKKAIEASYSLKVRVEDFMKKAFSGAKLSEEAIALFVRERVKARPGFTDFVNFCEASKIPLEVASGGVDLYAGPFFRKHGVAVKAFFGRARVTAGGLRISYPFLRRMDLSAFKASRVARLQRAGRRVVFFGDGPNDLKAAALADKVFAAGRLLRLCRASGIAASPLTDFSRAIVFLRKAAPAAGA